MGDCGSMEVPGGGGYGKLKTIKETACESFKSRICQILSYIKYLVSLTTSLVHRLDARELITGL